MNRLWLLVLVLVLVSMSSCISSKLIANNMVGSMDDMKTSFFAEESPTYAREAGPALMKMLDGFLVSSPENVGLLSRGAEMNCAFAQTFLDDHDRTWAQVMYKRGKGYGMKGLSLEYPDLAKALSEGTLDSIKAELKKVDEDDIRLLFWTGICWGGEINAAMEAGMMPQLPKVRAIMDRTMELNDNYYFSAVHIFYGTFWAGRSEMLGGDAEKGREYFEKAIELTEGRFLLWKFMFAKVYAVQAQKPALYVSLLNEVVNAPRDFDNDSNRLANQMARTEARRFLNMATDFFPNYVPPKAGDGFVEEDIDDLDLN